MFYTVALTKLSPVSSYFLRGYVLTFHHSQERRWVVLRGSVWFLGRYNHSQCVHRYTGNLKTEPQTYSQRRKKNPVEWTRSWTVNTQTHFHGWPPLRSFHTAYALLPLGLTWAGTAWQSQSCYSAQNPWLWRLGNCQHLQASHQPSPPESCLFSQQNSKLTQYIFFHITTKISNDIWEMVSQGFKTVEAKYWVNTTKTTIFFWDTALGTLLPKAFMLSSGGCRQ